MAKRTEILTVRVSPEVKKAVQELAERSYQGVSAFMNNIIEKYIQEAKENEDYQRRV